MNNILPLVITAAAILIILLVGVASILAYLYFSSKGQVTHLAQELYRQWREKDLETVRKQERSAASQEALTQLSQWRENEIETVRSQQLEIAQKETNLQFEKWKEEHTLAIRQDAIQKSQAVTMGKVTEHFIPYLPDFTYNPKDARFLGSPIDFVVFDGLTEGEVKRVVFIEFKTGESKLSTRERRIRDAVRSGKVTWEELRYAPEKVGTAAVQMPMVDRQRLNLPVVTDSEIAD